MSQILSGHSPEFTNPLNFVNNIDSELPKLVKLLDDNYNCENVSPFVKFLFGSDSVLRHLSINDLEIKILKPTLHSFQKIFSSNLGSALDILGNTDLSPEEVSLRLSDILQICLDILEGYYGILEHLQHASSLIAKEVESLIITLPGILLEAFTHCQGSENHYGSYFASTSELLSALFRKSYDLSSLFYKVLDGHIVFDCSLENDVCLLVTVLEMLCSIGEIVVDLDIKTLVEQWKGLAKLLTKYSPYLKDRINVSQPIQFMIQCLEKSIAVVCDIENHDDKLRNRNLKIGSFILKIIVKLCEMYSGYFDSSINDLFKLLLLLNRCSRMSRNESNDELERFIVIGAGPLLSHLAKDRQFIEIFQNASENYDILPITEKIGFFYTHLRIFKFLINNTDLEVKSNWLKLPLVQSVVTLFSKSSRDLDLTIRIEDTDTYTALVSVTVAYVISNFATSQFIILEEYLHSLLFSPDVEVGILSSDLLTLLCRLTNEDVCLSQTRYLFSLLGQPAFYNFRPEVSLVRSTAARLYSLLSKSGKEFIERDFPLYNHIWRHVKLSPLEKISSENLRTENINTPKDFVDMVEGLYIRCRSSTNAVPLINADLTQVFKNTLSGLVFCMKKSEPQPDWWCNVLYLLMKCVKYIVPYLKEDCFIEVMNSLFDLAMSGLPSTSFCVSGAVTDISYKNTEMLTPDSMSKVFSIFFLCFAADNVLIKQMVSENFLSTEKTINYDLCRIDEEARQDISNYSQRYLLNSNNLLYSFNVGYTHKCRLFEYDCVYSPPSKKFKLDSEVSLISEEIQKLKVEVNNLVMCVKQKPLSVEERQEVLKIICTLKDL